MSIGSTSLCAICDTFSPKQLRTIIKLYKAGAAPEQISEQFNIEQEEVVFHIENCIVDGSDGYKILERSILNLNHIVSILIRDIEDGKYLEIGTEDSIDGRALVSNFLSAQRELRESVLTINRIKSSQEILDNINEIVINPLIKQAIVILTEELRRVRDDLFLISKNNEKIQNRIKLAIDNAILRFGERLQSESYEGIKEKLETALTKSE